jgi:hypothetical protein
MFKTAYPTTILCMIIFLQFVIALPVRGVDQVVKLYICQIEHDLDEITSWENTAPDKFRIATKKGKLTPLEAAQESAGMFVNTERIRCDEENRVVVEKIKSEGKIETPYFAIMDGTELESYCPRTMKNYGHPCK